ncbi:MAG: DUF2958 domain-containing protein [Gammaproteobacteria bacterium]|nr:DUF2958 domain-containing protein [Gammaproteobacteria bacterium]
MKLLTDKIREKLRKNVEQPDADHFPAVKFFDPCGGATWLFTELGGDGDTLFGLCDLGMGFPELGCASLREISQTRGALGLPMERDRHFRAAAPLSVYAKAARSAGGIVERGEHFDAALARQAGQSAAPAGDEPDSRPPPGQPIPAN